MKPEQLAAMGIAEETVGEIMKLYGAEMGQRATEQAVQGLRFTSKGARSAFLQALSAREIPAGEEGFDPAGYQAFLAQYQQEDPGAFLEEDAPPRFVAPTPGAGSPARNLHAQANDALRAILRRE